jgi:hypothetical protein
MQGCELLISFISVVNKSADLSANSVVTSQALGNLSWIERKVRFNKENDLPSQSHLCSASLIFFSSVSNACTAIELSDLAL